jgi:ureidoglycolate lyase
MSAPRWRPMRAGDLARVKAVSDIVHRGLPERIEVLAEKRALFPQGAFVLERDGALEGYALSHPYRLAALPALDTLLGALPDDADCLYLHDIAILPASRGHGSARAMVNVLAALATRWGFRALALTSVYGTEKFWASCGFAEHDAPGMAGKLASYGGPARYMTREVPQDSRSTTGPKMTRAIAVEPLTREAFAQFGDVIDADGLRAIAINQGFAQRWDGQANIDVARGGGAVNVSLFEAQPRPAPIEIALMERHPLGSQLFAPMQDAPWLVLVCADPREPASYRAFRATGRQGVNYARNVWHHPLLVLDRDSRFLVVDRTSPGDNLEEFELDPGARLLLAP